MAILAAALEVSPPIEALLRDRFRDLSLDFDGLYAKALERVEAARTRQSRRSLP